jgi:hypothetical protein
MVETSDIVVPLPEIDLGVWRMHGAWLIQASREDHFEQHLGHQLYENEMIKHQ